MSGEIKHGLDDEGRAQMRQRIYEQIDLLTAALTIAALDEDQFLRIYGFVVEIERELGRRP